MVTTVIEITLKNREELKSTIISSNKYCELLWKISGGHTEHCNLPEHSIFPQPHPNILHQHSSRITPATQKVQYANQHLESPKKMKKKSKQKTKQKNPQKQVNCAEIIFYCRFFEIPSKHCLPG